MNWEHSPQRQKALQKIEAMSGDNKALTRILTSQLATKYAGQDIAKEIEALRMAATDTERERNLQLNEQRLGLRRDMLNLDKKSGREAEVLGWGNIGTSTLFGIGDLYQKRQQAKQLEDLSKFIRGK